MRYLKTPNLQWILYLLVHLHVCLVWWAARTMAPGDHIVGFIGSLMSVLFLYQRQKRLLKPSGSFSRFRKFTAVTAGAKFRPADDRHRRSAAHSTRPCSNDTVTIATGMPKQRARSARHSAWLDIRRRIYFQYHSTHTRVLIAHCSSIFPARCLPAPVQGSRFRCDCAWPRSRPHCVCRRGH